MRFLTAKLFFTAADLNTIILFNTRNDDNTQALKVSSKLAIFVIKSSATKNAYSYKFSQIASLIFWLYYSICHNEKSILTFVYLINQ